MKFDLLLVFSLFVLIIEQASATVKPDFMFRCYRPNQDCANNKVCDKETGICGCDAPTTDLYDCATIATGCSNCASGADGDQVCVDVGGTPTCFCKDSNFVRDDVSFKCIPRVTLKCTATDLTVSFKPLADFAGKAYVMWGGGHNGPQAACNLIDPGTEGNPWETAAIGYDSTDCKITKNEMTVKSATEYSVDVIIRHSTTVISATDLKVTVACTRFDAGGVAITTIAIEQGFDAGINNLPATDLNQNSLISMEYIEIDTAAGTTNPAVDLSTQVYLVLKLNDPTTYDAMTVIRCRGSSVEGMTSSWTFYNPCSGANPDANKLVFYDPKAGPVTSMTQTLDAKDTAIGIYVFRMQESEDKVFLQCDVKLCTSADTCEAKADAETCKLGARRKREASHPITAVERNTTQLAFATTVLEFKTVDINSEQNTSNDDDDENCSMFVAAAIVAGVLLLICLILTALLTRAVWYKNTGKSESRDDLRPVAPAYNFQLPRAEVGKY